MNLSQQELKELRQLFCKHNFVDLSTNTMIIAVCSKCKEEFRCKKKLEVQ